MLNSAIFNQQGDALMNRQSMTSLCAVAAVLTLTACARPDTTATTVAAPLPLKACDNSYESGIVVNSSGPGVVQSMKQLVNGQNTRDVLMDETKRDNAIATMGGVGVPFAAKVQSIRNSTFGRQLGGVSVRSFLDAAMTTQTGGLFSAVSEFETEGKVVAYFYDATGNKESCLQVEMTTKTKHGNSPWHAVVYRWHVFGDFQVARRLRPGDDGYDDTDVFPDADTMPISVSMAGSFDSKLWARSAMIQVRKVEHKSGNGAFSTFPAAHKIYKSTAGSCLDMMFHGQPPQTLASNAAPPFYCLGRCKYPPIINTK
jgi:hypothetical protein